MGSVIWLEFKSPHVEEETITFICCKNCRNKTYTLTQDRTDDFPLMKCAACGNHIGRMGWSHDDPPPKENGDGQGQAETEAAS